ncbi:class I SAM-dependent methyltransferase [Dyadobacter bucti]|uniref:class I SAM-dependent methyltransferase n=1 Tax=Dyadobacter bucti TaxID=2572203 RepID=UPI0011092139|nr:class I SAM-dependent methyltransferase [Dyadobacter bucti]
MKDNLKAHWENIYSTSSPDQLSWTEPKPAHSLALIQDTNTAKDSAIIDIGGGDSRLVDYLLLEGYRNITVLDVSAKAIEKAQKRLGAKSEQVTWLVGDILDFKPERQYAIWHDRAVFHFLITAEQKAQYKRIAENSLLKGHMILGTFSLSGPTKCSGLPVSQYDMASLSDVFKDSFAVNTHFYAGHITPFQTNQDFLFADFIKINN